MLLQNVLLRSEIPRHGKLVPEFSAFWTGLQQQRCLTTRNMPILRVSADCNEDIADVARFNSCDFVVG